MVCHQTLAFDPRPEAPRLLLQQLEIHPAVVLDEEDVLLVVPALRHMVARPRDDYPCGP